jgi:hypothetical protein
MNWKIPVEIQTAIADGIAKLLVLRLRGSPAQDTVNPLIKTWIDTLNGHPIQWDAKQDVPRINAAFMTLQRTVKFWPAPSDLIDAMPPRQQRLSLDYKPKATMSEATRKLLDGLKERLRGGYTKPSNESGGQ